VLPVLQFAWWQASCPITGLTTTSIYVSTRYENCAGPAQSNSPFVGNFRVAGHHSRMRAPFLNQTFRGFSDVARADIHESEQGIRKCLQRISIAHRGIDAFKHGSFLTGNGLAVYDHPVSDGTDILLFSAK
jgi:hypothetical protein